MVSAPLEVDGAVAGVEDRGDCPGVKSGWLEISSINSESLHSALVCSYARTHAARFESHGVRMRNCTLDYSKRGKIKPWRNKKLLPGVQCR